MRNAATRMLMRQRSASIAIEPNMTPAAISITIIVAVMAITMRVRRSAVEVSMVLSCECC